MVKKMYIGPNGGKYIMRHGKKQYLKNNKFGVEGSPFTFTGVPAPAAPSAQAWSQPSGAFGPPKFPQRQQQQQQQREAWAYQADLWKNRLREEGQAAFDQGDFARVEQIQQQLMELEQRRLVLQQAQQQAPQQAQQQAQQQVQEQLQHVPVYTPLGASGGFTFTGIPH